MKPKEYRELHLEHKKQLLEHFLAVQADMDWRETTEIKELKRSLKAWLASQGYHPMIIKMGELPELFKGLRFMVKLVRTRGETRKIQGFKLKGGGGLSLGA